MSQWFESEYSDHIVETWKHEIQNVSLSSLINLACSLDLLYFLESWIILCFCDSTSYSSV